MKRKTVVVTLSLCIVIFLGLIAYSLHSLDPIFRYSAVEKKEDYDIVFRDSIYFEYKLDYFGDQETTNILQRVINVDKSTIPSTAIFRFKSLDISELSFRYHDRAKSLGWEDTYGFISSFNTIVSSKEMFQELIEGHEGQGIGPTIPRKGIITMITPSYELDFEFEYYVIDLSI